METKLNVLYNCFKKFILDDPFLLANFTGARVKVPPVDMLQTTIYRHVNSEHVVWRASYVPVSFMNTSQLLCVPAQKPFILTARE